MGAEPNWWWLELCWRTARLPSYRDCFDESTGDQSKDQLQGKVLWPILDEIWNCARPWRSEVSVRCQEGRVQHLLSSTPLIPVDPKQYPLILARKIEELRARSGADNPQLLELQSATSAFGHLPDRSDTAEERRAERNRDKEIHKRRLATLCTQSADVLEFVLRNVVD